LSAQSQPVQSAANHPINELIRDFWDGKISEARFMDCFLEAGGDPREIELILEEIRNEDMA
jgi:hypothetical protein